MREKSRAGRLWGWLLVPLLVVAAVAVWFMSDPAFRKGPSRTDASAALSKDDFGQRVRAYILENPEIVMEAAQLLQERQRAAEESEITTVVAKRADEIFRDAESPVGGNPDGDVTMVEFFDYNCPYCRQVAPTMQDAEAADPKLRIVYKEFPILGPNSIFSAKAALAVHRQGKYVAFHNAMMVEPGVADEAKVMKIAAEIGADITRLKSDMEDPALTAAFEKNIALAQALRINGTPGFVIGDQIVRGAIDLKAMQGFIQEARKKKQ